jgi:hypothetical protein
MRVLNSGRRWGNDVPTSLDLSRDIDVLGVQVGDRSTKQLQMNRRLAALEADLQKVTLKSNAAPGSSCLQDKTELNRDRWRPGSMPYWRLLETCCLKWRAATL